MAWVDGNRSVFSESSELSFVYCKAWALISIRIDYASVGHQKHVLIFLLESVDDVRSISDYMIRPMATFRWFGTVCFDNRVDYHTIGRNFYIGRVVEGPRSVFCCLNMNFDYQSMSRALSYSSIDIFPSISLFFSFCHNQRAPNYLQILSG